MGWLGRHPDVSAISTQNLSQQLFFAARDRIRERRTHQSDAGSSDLVAVGRAEGDAALLDAYAKVRAASGARAVVLHDPSGPMFPFLEPPAVSLLVLVRNAEAAAAAIGAIGVERVVAAARDALVAFNARVAGFGIPADRIITVEEDRLEADPDAGLGELCRILGVDADPAIRAAMLAPAAVDVRFEGGA